MRPDLPVTKRLISTFADAVGDRWRLTEVQFETHPPVLHLRRGDACIILSRGLADDLVTQLLEWSDAQEETDG